MGNPAHLVLLVPLDLQAKLRLSLSQFLEVRACLDLLVLQAPWELLVHLVNVELLEDVVQREHLECLVYLEALVVLAVQVLLGNLVLQANEEKMANLDVNIARMI